MASIAQWLVLIRAFMGKETSTSLLKSLEEKDIVLNNMVHDFAEIAIRQKIQIRCFYETRETQIAKFALSGWLANLVGSVKVHFKAFGLCFHLLTLHPSSFRKHQLVLMVTNAFRWMFVTPE